MPLFYIYFLDFHRIQNSTLTFLFFQHLKKVLLTFGLHSFQTELATFISVRLTYEFFAITFQEFFIFINLITITLPFILFEIFFNFLDQWMYNLYYIWKLYDIISWIILCPSLSFLPLGRNTHVVGHLVFSLRPVNFFLDFFSLCFAWIFSIILPLSLLIFSSAVSNLQSYSVNFSLQILCFSVLGFQFLPFYCFLSIFIMYIIFL